MKLVELITKLERKKLQMPNKSEHKEAFDAPFVLDYQALKGIEKYLFDCDEFKNVIRVNYLPLPNYHVDEETNEPIIYNTEFLGGKLMVGKSESFMVNPGQEIKFNKVIDIYSIMLNKRFLTNENLDKSGIWIYPTKVDTNTFDYTNQIKVIWDPNQLKEVLALVGTSETPKQRLMRMFESALNDMTPNIPCEYVLTIRCSERSIANEEDFKAPEPIVEDEDNLNHLS